jgi:hypothetical protein
MDDVGGCQSSLARLAWASYLGLPSWGHRQHSAIQ